MSIHISNKSILSALLLVNLLVTNLVMADEPTSISVGQLSKSLSTSNKLDLLNDKKTALLVDQQTGKATGKARNEILKNNMTSAKSPITSARHTSYNNYADFTIYGATSILEEDYDSDGFYQTFSVIFDADIYSYTLNQLGEVYALLYISKNGGPWTHYYTTDSFLIEGDTELDEYEVMTTFISGYSTDHYDILIDLYQVGNPDVVASYSADDSNALYALSLESADYDEPYVEVIDVIEISHYGGSFPLIIILFMLSIYVIRTKHNTSNC